MGHHHQNRCRPGCRPNCGCQKPSNEMVYPTKQNVVNCYTEETVKHIHPSHTTVKNHHLIKNENSYPHTTSTENFVNEVDVQGTSTGPGMGGNDGHHHHGHHHGHHGHHGHHQGHCQKRRGCRCGSCRRGNRWF